MGRGESEELDPEEKRQARGILETLGGRGGGGACLQLLPFPPGEAWRLSGFRGQLVATRKATDSPLEKSH